ncbi:MAG: TIGR01777 family protein [Proteobacteria bacterium]|nr:MAG: TIGR01777 family protein [Pseudomonadota bacterium]
MKTILISGANGFIARNFMHAFAHKYKFIRLSHSNTTENHISMADLQQAPQLLQEVDIVLNLAGAGIGDKKWNTQQKHELLTSRLTTTSQLVTLFNQHNPNAHFISASAIGIYPTDCECDENTPINYQEYHNFSQEITRKWETTAHNYSGNLTITRFGVVLAGNGGAFPKMLQPFKIYVGGKIGRGNQYFTWIALPDLLHALEMIIDQTIVGTYNLTAPLALSNHELSSIIANTWHKPNWLPLPEFMIKLLFGQMGEELFLNSLQVVPTRLLEQNFNFIYPDFASCALAIKNNKF